MRRIKTIAVLTALALAAVATAGAASASASGFVAGTYPAEYSGQPTGNVYLGINDGTLECYGGPSFAGTEYKPAESITTGSMAGATCGFFGSSPLTTNGCQLTFHPGPSGTGSGTFDIGPVGCGPIKLVGVGGYCTVTIPAQTGLAATYTNVGSGSTAAVQFESTATKLKYSESGMGCSASGSFSNGSLSGTWKISAKTLGGLPTSLQVAPQLPVGVFLNGGKVEAESYPVNLSGSQKAASEKILGTNTGDISCKTAVFNSSLGEASSTLSINPAFSECQAFGFTATVKMNNCRYVVNVATGKADIACPEGAKIEIISAFNSCNTTVPAQSNLEGVTVSNVGSGFNRGVSVQLSLKGVTYSQSGFACAKTGTSTNGTSSIGFTLLGSH
jgi:hypothetical protein